MVLTAGGSGLSEELLYAIESRPTLSMRVKPELGPVRLLSMLNPSSFRTLFQFKVIRLELLASAVSPEGALGGLGVGVGEGETEGVGETEGEGVGVGVPGGVGVGVGVGLGL